MLNIHNLRWKACIENVKTRFLAKITVFAALPVTVYKKPDQDFEILVPVNKNWSQALNIQFWFWFLQTPVQLYPASTPVPNTVQLYPASTPVPNTVQYSLLVPQYPIQYSTAY